MTSLLCTLSYGGSGTNWLNRAAMAAGIAPPHEFWGPHCHPPSLSSIQGVYPHPHTLVYIYREPTSACASQIARAGIAAVNIIKLGGGPGPHPEEKWPELLDELMAKQMRTFLAEAPTLPTPTVFVRYECLASAALRRKLEEDTGLPTGVLDNWKLATPRCGWVAEEADAVYKLLPDYQRWR